jgi:hypothetical protein
MVYTLSNIYLLGLLESLRWIVDVGVTPRQVQKNLIV